MKLKVQWIDRKHMRVLLVTFFVSLVMVMGECPLLWVDAMDSGGISDAPESPSNFSQYTDAGENARLLYDNGSLVLKYRDAVAYPVAKYPDSSPAFRLQFGGYAQNAYFIQTWTGTGGMEYVDLFYFRTNGSVSSYEILVDGASGKGGFYGECFHLQFRYSDGGLVQTAVKRYGQTWQTVIDSYVLDCGFFKLYAQTTFGHVSIGGKEYYDNAPSPYDFKYKTTFRLLAGDALVYNTYYYDNCYKGGDDIIKCVSSANTTNESGRQTVVESVKLADGSTSVAKVSNPATMC